MTLYKKIADELAEKIERGELTEKLPPIRALATEMGVNNTTVVAAYKFLEKKRLVYSVVGSGTYITKTPAPPPTPKSIVADCINFASGYTDPALFPGGLRRAFDEALARDGAGAFSAYDGLKDSAAALVGAGEVRVFTDIRAALEEIAAAIITPGDVVFLANPTASWVAAVFSSHGARIVEKFSGKIRPKIIFSTNLCYTEITIAEKSDAYIIEADAEGDFFYTKKPAHAADIAHERVFRIKCLDRILAPGIAAIVAHPPKFQLAGTYEASGFIQRALDIFIRSGDFAAHAKKMRGIYEKKYRRAISAAEVFLSPHATFSREECGLSIWVTPKNKIDCSEEFLKHRVLVSPWKLFSAAEPGSFRISFANVSDDEITKGIGIIASVLAGKAVFERE